MAGRVVELAASREIDIALPIHDVLSSLFSCRQLLQQVKQRLSLRRGEMAAAAEPLLPHSAPPIPLHHAKMVAAAQVRAVRCCQ